MRAATGSASVRRRLDPDNRLTWAAMVLALAIGAGTYDTLAAPARVLGIASRSVEPGASVLGGVRHRVARLLRLSDELGDPLPERGRGQSVAIAAALGVALAGSARFPGSRTVWRAPSRGRLSRTRRGFVAIGVLTVTTLADYWAEAWIGRGESLATFAANFLSRRPTSP